MIIIFISHEYMNTVRIIGIWKDNLCYTHAYVMIIICISHDNVSMFKVVIIDNGIIMRHGRIMWAYTRVYKDVQ